MAFELTIVRSLLLILLKYFMYVYKCGVPIGYYYFIRESQIFHLSSMSANFWHQSCSERVTVPLTNPLLLLVCVAANNYSSPIRFATKELLKIKSRMEHLEY